MDLALGSGVMLLWLVVVLADIRLLGPDRGLATIPFPTSTLEILLWVGVSVSASVCEEVVFRGYFQRQFEAFTRSVLWGSSLQCILFGILHGWQSGHTIVMPGAYAVMFTLLARWRRSLRPGMIAHTLTDALLRLGRIG